MKKETNNSVQDHNATCDNNMLCDGFLKTTEVIELTSKIHETPMKGLFAITALIKINGETETDTIFLCYDKKDLKRIKVGFKWTGEYWGSGS